MHRIKLNSKENITVMRKDIRFVIEKAKEFLRYINAQKTSIEVKEFCKKNVKSFEFTKNRWNNNYNWDCYFQRHDHSIRSNNYVPYDYFNYKIQPNLNNKEYAILTGDKNLYDAIFGNFDINLPKTIFRYYNGVYMDENYSLIDNINNKINSIDQNIIIKPTMGTYGGKGIEKYEFVNGELRNVKDHSVLNSKELLCRYRSDFIVQENVIQHKMLNELYPFSVNTLRVESYRSVKTNQVEILMGVLRMGRNRSFVDNLSGGGIAVGLKIDNDYNVKLREFAYVPFSNEKYSYHSDTNIKFKDYEIPNFYKVVESIKKLSNLIPYLRVISWDFCIDKDGNPILIELNKTGGIWACQEANGIPYFNRFSEEVMEYLSQNQKK